MHTNLPVSIVLTGCRDSGGIPETPPFIELERWQRKANITKTVESTWGWEIELSTVFERQASSPRNWRHLSVFVTV